MYLKNKIIDFEWERSKKGKEGCEIIPNPKKRQRNSGNTLLDNPDNYSDFVLLPPLEQEKEKYSPLDKNRGVMVRNFLDLLGKDTNEINHKRLKTFTKKYGVLYGGDTFETIDNWLEPVRKLNELYKMHSEEREGGGVKNKAMSLYIARPESRHFKAMIDYDDNKLNRSIF